MAYKHTYSRWVTQYFVTVSILLSALLSTSLVLAQTQKGDSQTDGQLASRVVSIPLPNSQHSVKAPAADLLISESETLDSDIAAQRAESGFDLSTLNPVQNKFWQNNYYPLQDASSKNYPDGNDVSVRFLNFESTSGLPGTDLAYVTDLVSGRNFRLGISRYANAMMMRAGLLRRIGYFVPMPKYYKKLKIVFANEETKIDFSKNIIMDIGDLFFKHLVINEDTKEHSYTVNAAVLEQVSTNNFDVNWGGAPDPQVPEQAGLVDDFSQKRAYRSLLVPYLMVDVPEAPQRFDTRFVYVSSGYLNIAYWRGDAFRATSYDDVLWVMKRIQKLSAEDIHDIVWSSGYPESINKLTLIKIFYRLNDALRVVGLKPSFPEKYHDQDGDYDLNLTSKDGLVVKGNVNQEYISGYPIRFTHGDRTSPLIPGDIERILHVVFDSSLLQTALDKLNEKLQALTAAEAYKNFITKYQQDIIAQIKAHPELPIYRKVQGWNGTLAGFNVNANRYLATGTFTGSNAPVQLVDNLSFSANLGRFRALDGLDYLPMAGAQLSYTREYTHVHPISEVKDAFRLLEGKENWTDKYIAPLKVQIKMDHLVDILKDSEIKTKDEQGNDQVKKSIDEFLGSLKDGEVFTVTSSIGFTAYAQSSGNIDTLFGFAPIPVLNTISIEGDASRVTTNQVSFYKVGSGADTVVHIYVRRLKDKSKAATLGASFYLDLLRLRGAQNSSDVQTDAYVVRVGGNNGQLSDEQVDDLKEKLRLCLVPLFKRNETENFSLLEKSKFIVKHILQEGERKFKFLAWQFSGFKENHTVSIQPPDSFVNPDIKGKDDIITIFRSKIGSLMGVDWVSAAVDLLNGYLTDNQYKFNLAVPQTGGNPANMLYGKAHWKLINSETDISEKREQMGSVSIIQNVWSGWSLAKPAFTAILNEIKKTYEDPEIDSYILTKEQDFLTTKRVDFYRITTNVSINQSGLDKLRDLLLQPSAGDNQPPKARPALEKIIRKIICKNDKLANKAICSTEVRYKNDQQLYADMLKIFGGGDAQAGYEKYKQVCELERSRRAEKPDNMTDTDEFKGTEFSCLTSWMRALLKLAYEYPKGQDNAAKIARTKWATALLAILDKNIPTPLLLRYLEKPNYLFVIQISGYRVGDNDGDLGYYPNTYGDPQRKEQLETAGGLVNYWIVKLGLVSIELDKTLAGVQ